MIEINALIDNYYQWLKKTTESFTDTETGWTQITTPFTGMFNDPIEIYVRRKNGSIELSDDGLTLRNLKLMGVSFSRSQRRKEILNKILLNYGIELTDKNELVTKATEKDFSQKKHNLISAISNASDMFMLAKHSVASVFYEDVQAYLEKQNLIFTPQFIARGSTGIEFTFDFQIAYKKHEIIIQSFNRLNTLNLPRFLFAWEDIKRVRENITGKKLNGLALINDSKNRIHSELLDAILYEKADYILWSEREVKKNLEKLIA